MRQVLKITRTRSGAVLVMVALALTALLAIAALVIDLGLLYVAQQNAQNIADQCAVSSLVAIKNYSKTDVQKASVDFEMEAISRYLFAAYPKMTTGPDTRKVSLTAGEHPGSQLFFGVGSRHHIFNETVNPKFVVIAEGDKDYNVSMQVECNIPVDLTFSQAWGINQRATKANAVARLYPTPRLEYNFVPWAIDRRAIDPDNEPHVGTKASGRVVGAFTESGGSGAAVEILAIGLPGGDYYTRLSDRGESIVLGAEMQSFWPDAPVSINTVKALDNPSLYSVTADALYDRFGSEPGVESYWRYESWKSAGQSGVYPNSARILMAVVVDKKNKQADGSYRVKGFAPLFVTRYDENTGDVDFVLISGLLSQGRVRWSLNTKPRYAASMISKVMIYDFGTQLSN